MALNVEAELAALETISGLDEKHHLSLSKHVARLQAAIQLDIANATLNAQRQTAESMANASEQLSRSIGAFTEASNRGTKELAMWSARTATWTKWLTIATVALFLAAVVQAVVAVASALQ